MSASPLPSEETIRARFAEKGVRPIAVHLRSFPNETIYIVEISSEQFTDALAVANAITASLENAFVTLKRSKPAKGPAVRTPAVSLSDARITTLIELLNARSRTSEQQPSLRYIRDAAAWLNVCLTPRHNLIFGRRGVGKTALMLEAKRLLETAGDATFWMNLQSLRGLNASQAFLHVALRLCDIPVTVFAGRDRAPLSVESARAMRVQITRLLDEERPRASNIAKIVPQMQHFLKQLNAESQHALYVFLDDFHYLDIDQQPRFLDLVHGATRDNDVWLKASGIKHQSRWFSDNPPMGLQTTHDASIIDLDITLEDPEKARRFLYEVLATYVSEADLNSVHAGFSASAIDRLVIASGGVPRDFLLLGASALQVARERTNARQAGVQDVNESAGRASKAKLTELEEDAASSTGQAQLTLRLLQHLRTFLLDEKRTTYFRVEFFDKEHHSAEYAVLQSLMDLRLVHLVSASLSDEHHAGRRYEVYALDLSQFSGARLKYNLRALDLSNNYLVLRNTGTKEKPKVGDTSRALLGLLRRGPLFPLERVTPLMQPATGVLEEEASRPL